jgi:hypothetical protein
MTLKMQNATMLVDDTTGDLGFKNPVTNLDQRLASLDSPIALRRAGAQQLQIVGSRTGLRMSTSLTGSDVGSMSRTGHKVYGNPSSIVLAYAGFDLRSVDEKITPAGVYRVTSVAVAAGGTGHAVGDVISLVAGVKTATVRVVAVAAGVITKVQLLNPGVYDTPAADASAQSATTGAGIDSTFNFEWSEGAYMINAAIEPDFTAASVTSGQYNGRWARKGVLSDSTSAVDIVPKPGEIVMTDPIPLSIPNPTVIGLRQYARGKLLALGLPTNPLSEKGSVGTPGNVALTGSVLTPNAQTAVFQPMLILGVPTSRVTSFLVLSHSIAAAIYSSGDGNGDTGDADGNVGWPERACAGSFPVVNFARSGDSYSNWFKSPASGSLNGRTMRYSLISLARPTDIILDCSVNDIGDGSTYATVLGYETQIVNELKSLLPDVRIWLVTTTPQTTSDNSWTTGDGAAHQTYVTTGGIARNVAMQARNAALRAGTYTAGHTYYLDWGALVETTVGSGYWPANVTGDGTHLLQTKQAAAGALMRTQILARIASN